MLNRNAWRARSLLSFLLATTLSVASPTLQTVRDLDAYEPFPDALVHHMGLLWVGHSRFNGGPGYKLEALTSDGDVSHSFDLPHSVRHLYPYGPDGVLAIGSAYPTKAYYTIVSRYRGGYRAKHTELPSGVFPDAATGTPQTKLYFADPGGKPGAVISGPEDLAERGIEAIFTPGRLWGVNWLSPKISGAGQLLLVRNFLFVLERGAGGLGDENVVRIDLSTGEGRRVFPRSRRGLVHMIKLATSDRIAVSEAGAHQIVMIDIGTNREAETVAVPEGAPARLTELGKCLVAGSYVAPKLSFVDWRSEGKEKVAEWDLSSAGTRFHGVDSLATDGERIFARSVRPCIPGYPCPEPKGVVVSAFDRETLQRCSR